MRSVHDGTDRTARAALRDEALRLFAAAGPDKVTVRQIASAAGVSAALVMHHFGSKDGLRAEVDGFVVDTFEALLGQLTEPGAEELSDPGGAGSAGAALLRHLPPGSPLPAYLRRLLLTDAEAGRRLFRRLFEVSQRVLTGLALAGRADPGRDPAARAALLLANDLAVLLLREQLADVLGVDPLSADGMDRWGPELLSIYAGGLTAAPGARADSERPVP